MKQKIRKVYHHRLKPAYEKTLNELILSANSLTYKEFVWIIGDGRSGTTWLQEAINFNKSYRQVFEPFHPKEVESICDSNFFNYMRPEQIDLEFEKHCNSVFNGTFSHPWSTKVNKEKLNESRIYKGLLVKDIFAHLFAKWVKERFPKVKIVLLLRHPFAVALSKQKLSHWHWMTEPMNFLRQENLAQDYLQPFKKVINTAEGYFEKQVLIWCIIHYVLLNQFGNDNILPIFYEDLCVNFEAEMSKIFSYVKSEYNNNTNLNLSRVDIGLSQTSIYSNSREAVNKGFDSWTSNLEKEKEKAGMIIMKNFGLDKIYDETAFPKRGGIKAFLGSENAVQNQTSSLSI